VVPGLPRPESDEYVELSQDKTLDFSSGYQVDSQLMHPRAQCLCYTMLRSMSILYCV